MSFALSEDIESADGLIIVDAMEMHRPPGSIICLEGSDIEAFWNRGKRSVHEVNLADLLDMARLRERLPIRRALVGIQPEHLGWGNEPSETITCIIPDAAREVLTLFSHWTHPKSQKAS